MNTEKPMQGRVLVTWIVFGFALWTSAGSARGQTAQPSVPVPVGQPAYAGQDDLVIEVDIKALVDNPAVFAKTTQGPIWKIELRPDRTLFQLPVIIKPGKKPTMLDRSSLKVEGARFVAWHLTDDPMKDRAGRRRPDAVPYQSAAELPRFTRKMTVHPDRTVTWRVERHITDGAVQNNGKPYTFVSDPSLLAKMSPGQKKQTTRRTRPESRRGRESGTVRRGTSSDRGRARRSGSRGSRSTSTRSSRSSRRSSRGGSYGSSRSNRSSRSRADSRDRRGTRDTNRPKDAARKRVTQMELRDAQTKFRALQMNVRNLPRDLEMPLPQRIWAVYDLDKFRSRMVIVGHSEAPWSIGQDQLTVLRGKQKVSSTVASRGRDRRRAQAIAGPMTSSPEVGAGSEAARMAARDARGGGDRRGGRRAARPRPRLQQPFAQQPFGGQASAYGQQQPTRRTAQVVAAQIQLMQTLSILAEDPHPYTQRLMAHAIVHHQLARNLQYAEPIFLIIGRLIRRNDPVVRTVFTAELVKHRGNPTARQLIAKIDAKAELTATDEERMEILRALLAGLLSSNESEIDEAAQRVTNELAKAEGIPPSLVLEEAILRCRDNPAAVPILIRQVRFGRMSDERLDDAMVRIIEYAGTDPVAAGWLDAEFLRSRDPKLVLRTLQVIARADTGSRSLGSSAKWAIDKIFGHPNTGSSLPIRKPKLRALIPIDSPLHGLFTALQHGDEKIREAAWHALPAFRIDEQGDFGPPNSRSDPYQVLLDAAKEQPVVPVEAPKFFAKQPDKDRASTALIHLLLDPSPDVQVAAAQAILGSHLPIGEALTREPFGFGERQGFGMNIYKSLTNRIPLLTNVLKQRTDENPVVLWLGREIARGVVPAESEWINQFTNDRELLLLAGSRDKSLAAGAVAVLVAAAGGDNADAGEIAKTWWTTKDRSVKNLEKQWDIARQGILLERMRENVGPYELLLNVYRAQPRQSGNARRQRTTPTDARTVDQRIPIGVVQLQVKGNKLSLGHDNVKVTMPKNLGIRIDKATDLKNLNSDKRLEQLTLTEGSARHPKPVSIDLRPMPDGSFSGELIVSGQVIGQLIMRPVAKDRS